MITITKRCRNWSKGLTCLALRRRLDVSLCTNVRGGGERQHKYR